MEGNPYKDLVSALHRLPTYGSWNPSWIRHLNRATIQENPCAIHMSSSEMLPTACGADARRLSWAGLEVHCLRGGLHIWLIMRTFGIILEGIHPFRRSLKSRSPLPTKSFFIPVTLHPALGSPDVPLANISAVLYKGAICLSCWLREKQLATSLLRGASSVVWVTVASVRNTAHFPAARRNTHLLSPACSDLNYVLSPVTALPTSANPAQYCLKCTVCAGRQIVAEMPRK